MVRGDLARTLWVVALVVACNATVPTPTNVPPTSTPTATSTPTPTAEPPTGDLLDDSDDDDDSDGWEPPEPDYEG
jgi:hypothetical protein